MLLPTIKVRLYPYGHPNRDLEVDFNVWKFGSAEEAATFRDDGVTFRLEGQSEWIGITLHSLERLLETARSCRRPPVYTPAPLS